MIFIASTMQRTWPLVTRVPTSTNGAATREEIVITVSDTGPGVPDELKEKVFYPFFTTKQSSYNFV